MPLELSVWRIDSGLTCVDVSKLDLESRLEDILARDISIASPHWMVIGRQVPTPWDKRIDLLCIDGEGQLIVLELKRDKTERVIVAQTLDYGSFVRTIKSDDVRRIFAKYQKDYFPGSPAKTIEEAFGEHFRGQPAPEELNTSHQLVIVAATLDGATERIVDYLADEYGVRINAVFFRVFKDGDREYLTRAWLRDTDAMEDGAPTTPAARERVAFNGEYYVNFGEGDHRRWEDARRFGFVSAGHGPKYRDAMQRLEPGNRIWVNVPGTGYVGVGIVEHAAMPVKDFMVKNEKDETIPLLQAGIACKNTRHGRRLVAAIELVSPANKDRPENRRAFVAKVAALLQHDVCVSLVDVVTILPFNLYADLLGLIGRTDLTASAEHASLYAVTLRGRKRIGRRPLLDTWFYPMSLGQPLSTLPIRLDVDLGVLLDLEKSYEETCRVLHIT